MQMESLLNELSLMLRETAAAVPSEGPAGCVLSLSNGRERAHSHVFTGATVADCMGRVRVALAQPEIAQQAYIYVRLDWITNVEHLNWRELKSRLLKTKRNYFNSGLALDPQFKQLFLAEELNANAMLYGGHEVGHACLNEGNFNTFGRNKYGKQFVLDSSDDTPVTVFRTLAVYHGPDAMLPVRLQSDGAFTGLRQRDPLDVASTGHLIASASEFLARQVQADGRFVYGLFPCFGRQVTGYNALRHASSLYSMIEAYELTRSGSLLAAIERATDQLVTQLIQCRDIQTPAGLVKLAFLVDSGEEIKLGGNAVCILALCKLREVCGTHSHDELLIRLGNAVAAMFNPQTGQFVHVLNWPDLTVKEKFRIIYYDGEATFALMRLYGVFKDASLLQLVESAFSYFIAVGHEQAHDHWLSYCVNELTKEHPRREYFEFGIRNFSGHLDFVLERITTFPTLLELMMAAESMLQRLASDEAVSDLLHGVDLEKFYRALHFRANYLLSGYFSGELAMFFAVPESVLGSFFIRHHAFRVRIDDVEHYLSGLIAYRRFLLERQPVSPRCGLNAWTAAAVANATPGRWLRPPPSEWSATGVSMWQGSCRSADIVFLRSDSDKRGVSASVVRKLSPPPRAIVTAEPLQFVDNAGIDQKVPVYQCVSAERAIFDLAAFARQQISGKLIAVTGSAGKTTTVHMLASVLGAPGKPVPHTQNSANLPFGVAWNVCQIPWNSDFGVLELAIGNMARNARIARPDLAVVINIGPSHLEYHGSTEQVAIKKSAIFSGVKRGGVAVICHDTEHVDILLAAAVEQGLNILTYGQHEQATFRLVQWDEHLNRGTVQAPTGVFEVTPGAIGLHMMLNALACLACSHALGVALERTVTALSRFRPVSGRGDLIELRIGQAQVTLMDQSYNANPLSVRAALSACRALMQGGRYPRLLLVLGDMLELGAESHRLHAQLVSVVDAVEAERIFLIGPAMGSLAPQLKCSAVTCHLSVEDMEIALGNVLQTGDLVLVKSSHGVGLNAWIRKLLKNISEVL